MPDVAFLAELSEQERLHFRNLVLIRPQLPTGGQLALIESLARTLEAPRLLTLIARTPHWLVHGPVLQALAENEATPEPIRRDLEMAVSLFDLMRDLDRASLEEKDERSETIKGLYQQLPADLKPVVKQQAKLLARAVSPTGLTLELPPLPVGEPDWEELTRPPCSPQPRPVLRASRQDLLARAEATCILADLQECLLDPGPEIRAAALKNPALDEDLLLASLARCTLPEFFEEIYAEARWYFRDPVREVIYGSPCCLEPLAKKMAVSRDLVALLERGPQNRRELHRAVSLFTQLDEGEYQYLTYWAKRRSPNMLRVIKIFFDRLQRRRVSHAGGFSTGREEEGPWGTLEERVFMANQATQPEQLIAALRDSDSQVFAIVLENPGLSAKEIIAALPHLPAERLLRVASHRAWGILPPVAEALVHCARMPERTALELLDRLESFRALVDILRDPRLPHVAVKEKALVRLKGAYAAMDIPQRILALRSSGGELLRHLTQEVLKDEPTLEQLISDRQLDPSILLRLARNKQTPRGILERIAGHPVLMAHPAVMQELLLNPKTPREAAIRIWGLLSESEQQHLLRSPHLPTPLRLLS